MQSTRENNNLIYKNDPVQKYMRLIINTLAYLNPLQQYDFEIHLFTLRAVTDITIGYYRRFKRSLMLQMH